MLRNDTIIQRLLADHPDGIDEALLNVIEIIAINDCPPGEDGFARIDCPVIMRKENTCEICWLKWALEKAPELNSKGTECTR